MSNRDDEFREIIRARLTEKRFIHSLNVAAEAKKLAEHYGADADKAFTAGLLHDILKDAPLVSQRDYLMLNGVELSSCELVAPKLWHAMAGAQYIEKELGVDDADIVTAVRYHTTGREKMSLLEKILYIADYISKDRSYDGVERMRDKAYTVLELAMLEGLQFTIKELADNRLVIHPDTIEAYNQTVREVLLLEHEAQ